MTETNRRADNHPGTMMRSHRLTLVSLASGIFLASFAAFIGALYSFDYFAGSLVPSGLFYIHPSMEIFGFLPLFVLGVSYAVLPRFKNTELRHIRVAALSIALLLAANATWISRNAMLQGAGDVSFVLSSVISFALLAAILGRPRGPLAVAEPFFWISLISLITAGLMKLYFNLIMHRAGWGFFPFLELTLIGFPAMMIFGVETRTIHFRFVKLNRQSLVLSYVTASLSLALTGLWIFVPRSAVQAVSLSISVFWILSCLLFLYGIRIFQNYVRPDIMARINERDLRRFFYFRNTSSIAGAWLLAGVVFAALYIPAVSSGYPAASWIRDAFIHSLGVGFIPTSIMAFTPTLLVSVMARRAPYRGLSTAPVVVYTLGNTWRVSVDVLNALGMNFLSFSAPYSVLLSAAGLILFIVMIVRMR